MQEDAALKLLTGALERWTLRRRTLVDASGKALPDGERTKLLPSGTDGVALEVTLEEDGEVASTRVEKDVHELRICKLDTAILRDKCGLTGEQLLATIALMATFDVVVLVNTPPGEALAAASAMKNLLSHHSGDGFELVLLKNATVFLRLPLAVLKSTDVVVFHDSRFKTQDKIKTISVFGDVVALYDGEEPLHDEEPVHDGWLRVSTGRAVDVQCVDLEVQIAEDVPLAEPKTGAPKAVEETAVEETAESKAKNGDTKPQLFCAKLIDCCE